jgi:hypothetical protein
MEHHSGSGNAADVCLCGGVCTHACVRVFVCVFAQKLPLANKAWFIIVTVQMRGRIPHQEITHTWRRY